MNLINYIFIQNNLALLKLIDLWTRMQLDSVSRIFANKLIQNVIETFEYELNSPIYQVIIYI